MACAFIIGLLIVAVAAAFWIGLLIGVHGWR